MVTRYGGVQAYQKLKPLMFGLIAGDVLAGLLVIIMGLIYNLYTGNLPRTYWVLPG
jgi:vacuolar-type H+-ATPase subunit I/STV1